jgi:hypothetical protein
MPLDRVVVDVVLTVVVLAVILFCLYRVVGWARGRQKRAYVIARACPLRRADRTGEFARRRRSTRIFAACLPRPLAARFERR